MFLNAWAGNKGVGRYWKFLNFAVTGNKRVASLEARLQVARAAMWHLEGRDWGCRV